MMNTISPDKMRILTNKKTRVYKLPFYDETSVISSEDIKRDEFHERSLPASQNSLMKTKPPRRINLWSQLEELLSRLAQSNYYPWVEKHTHLQEHAFSDMNSLYRIHS